jgi:hypothetical protein
MKTYYSKGRDGHRMETTKELPDGKTLKLSTSKRGNGGGVSTYATVGISSDNCFSFVVFQDFSKMILTEKTRVTEKAVRTQHQQALDNLEALEADIADHYAELAKKEFA